MVENNGVSLSFEEKIARLRLIRTEQVGPVTYHQLMHRFGSAGSALLALPGLARRGGRKTVPKIYPQAMAAEEMDRHDALGAEFVFWGTPAYPARLSVVTDAPPVLSVRGNGALLSKKAVAIVGARNASANGCRMARTVAGDVGRAGYLIVSGLARGIDAAAHSGALETGTVAVLGCGVDVVYPKQNAALYNAVSERGALISEVPLGTKPAARLFPRRNRIISGMARGVVVVEASLRSGSLITARLAGEQGREVFAVPGAAYDPRGRGANALIRDGAVLTECAEDILDVLKGMPAEPRPNAALRDGGCSDPLPETDDSLREAVLAALGPTPTSRDELIRHLELPAAAVATALLELELAGRLESLPGNHISRKPDA